MAKSNELEQRLRCCAADLAATERKLAEIDQCETDAIGSSAAYLEWTAERGRTLQRSTG